MTFLESQTLVADLLEDANFGYLSRTVVKLRLNLAQRELQGKLIRAGNDYYTKCVKTSTVSGQKAYALPSDFRELSLLEKVISGSGDTADTDPIVFLTPGERYQVFEVSGDPAYYWFEKNNLILRPTPNLVREIHLEYFYLAADLVNDSDVIDAPQEFHEFVPVLCAKKCFLKDGKTIAPIQEDLDRLERELARVATNRRADGPRMVVQTEAMY